MSTTSTPRKASPRRTPTETQAGARSRPVIGRLESPLTTYYLILGATVTLVVFGLIMVFSASSVEALLSDQASYSVFLRQLMFAGLGAVGAAVAVHLQVAWWKRLAVPTLLLAVALLRILHHLPGQRQDHRQHQQGLRHDHRLETE